jgi:subtilisin family serine protease
MNLPPIKKSLLTKRSSFAETYALVLLLGLLFLAAVVLPGISHAALPSSVGTQSAALKRGAQEFVPGEILVRFRSDTAAASETTALAVRSIGGRAMPLTLERLEGAEQLEGLRLAHVATEDTMEAIAALKARADVLYAEPNYIRHHDAAPDDTRYSELYALSNTGQAGGTAGADIRAEQAWNITTGSHSVVVGVIDEGVDINHPDLVDNIWTNPGEIGTDAQGHDKSTNGIDDDGDGLVDDVHGWDFLNNDNTVFDGTGTHGTHVAGTIGAVGNNGQGVAGVNWQVALLSLKFIGASGGTDANAIKAILFAKKLRDMWVASSGTQGANVRVLSNSWGGGGFSQASLDAIQAAGDSGILFVAAAGNFPDDPVINNDLVGHYPSSYNAPNVLAVAATDRFDSLASLSHYGANTVHLAAPGVNILGTTPNNTYSYMSGTSMATPHVSGVAALMCAANPNITLKALWHSLLYSTDQLPSLANKLITGGRLNAASAVQTATVIDTTPPGVITNLHLTSQSGRSVNLAWTASGDDGSTGRAALYTLNFVDANTGAQLTLAKLRPGDSGTLHNISTAIPYQHSSGTFQLRVFDKVGNEGTPASIPVTVDPGLAYPYTVAETSPEGLSTGGTALLLKGDDLFRTNYSLPFSFPFFGQSYTALAVSTNGALYLSTPPAVDNSSEPLLLSSQQMIAGLWDDLRTDVRSGDDVYVVQPDANRIIFRWQGVTYGDGTPASESPVNFEIELRRDGTILTRYGDGNTNVFPVVGISGGGQEAYTVASHTSKSAPLALTNAQTIVFEVNHIISGQVTAGAVPQSGLEVSLSGTQSATTHTDASGHYFFAVPAGGNYTVTPTQTPLYTFGSQSVTNLVSDQTLNFTGALRSYRISGQVRFKFSGIKGATVSLFGSQQATTTTDSNGNYSFDALAAGGNYTVIPEGTAYYSFTSQSVQALSGDKTFDFDGAIKTYFITGQVTAGGQPLIGVKVYLSSTFFFNKIRITGSNGGFAYGDLPAGESYFLSTDDTANYKFTGKGVENLSSDQTLNLDGVLRTITISGRATDSITGAPIGGVTINLGGPTSKTVTDDNGYYSFPNLPIGFSSIIIPLDNAFYTFSGMSLNNLRSDYTFNPVGVLKHYAIGGQVKDGSKGLSGVTVTLGGSRSAVATTDGNGFYNFADLPAKGSYTVNASKPYYLFPPGPVFDNLGSNQTADIAAQAEPRAIIFTNQYYDVDEGAGSITINVTRFGDPSGPATVDYSTSDNTARQRTDYTPASGTLSFAPGETNQMFTVLLTDNAFVDGSRTVNLHLSNPTGGVLGLAIDTNSLLTIKDNDVSTPVDNPADNAQFFVRQQYADFLNRAPDPGGLGYWTNQITQCGTNPQCIHDRRVGVADAFFFETEFQQTGSYIYRIYRAALGLKPTYAQFISDRGRVVAGPGLDQSKSAYALFFVHTPGFQQEYATTNTADQFVDKMLTVVKNYSGVDLSAQRSSLLSLYDGTETGKAAILRQVAESQALIDAEYNQSFVLMEYFGYLRRDPDQGGYDFWLSQVNKFPLRNVSIQHAMACSFITSAEYQTRFSSVVTHTNRECPQ